MMKGSWVLELFLIFLSYRSPLYERLERANKKQAHIFLQFVK